MELQRKAAVSLNLVRLVRAAALSFFYLPWPAVAASSDTFRSSYGAALVLQHPFALVSSMLCPGCRAGGVASSRKDVASWHPSVLMVTPVMKFPFAAALTPVVSSPFTSMAAPIALVLFFYYRARNITRISFLWVVV